MSATRSLSPSLAELVQAFGRITEGSPDPSAAFGLAHVRGELEVSCLALTEHPAAELLGFCAPEHWDALIVVVSATDLLAPVHQRVTLTYGRDRDGRHHAVLHRLDRVRVVELTDAPVGRLADICARVLGLPTPAPNLPPAFLLAHVWLERVFAAVVADPTADWDTLAELHPSANVAPSLDPCDLWRASITHAVRLGWAGVRLGGVAGELYLDDDLATWFDDGSYSRWVEEQLTPLEDLGEAIAALVPPKVFTKVLRTIAPRLGEP